jgi:cytochrome P450
MMLGGGKAVREYDLLGEAFYANPYPTLADMRREDPCWFDPRLKAFITTRYHDIRRVLYDHGDFSSQRVAQFANAAPPYLQTKVDAYVGELSRWLLFADPPHHAILRARLLQSFGSRFPHLVGEVAEQAVTEALDKVEARPAADVINDFAYPVPTRVLARVLGISDVDIERFKTWTTDIFALIGAGVANEAAVETGYRGVTDLRKYVLALLQHKRESPTDDVLSALANPANGESSEIVPDDDIVGLFMAMIVAGHETTTGLIGNALRAILSDLRCRRLILGNPDFPEAAVDELLRYDGPVLSIMRRAKRDVVIAGQVVEEGSFIFNVLNAGNRDPRKFSDPDRLDFNRPQPDHVGLGTGIHQCVGAPMARRVIREAVPRFVHRFPNATLADGCVWQRNISIRGMLALPVILNGSQAAMEGASTSHG